MEESPCSVKDKLQRISRLLEEAVSPGSDKENTNGLSSYDAAHTSANMVEAFSGRVNSFGPGQWGVREVSPMECARRGWRLIQPDTMQCVTCSQVVYAALPPLTDKLAYSQFLEKLKTQVLEGHRKACWWRNNPSSASLTRPPQLATLEDLRNLANTAHTLAALDSALPHLHMDEIMDQLGVDDELVKGLYSTQDAVSAARLTAAVLVLAGWSRGAGAYLRCKKCCREVGLWSFVTRADNLKATDTTSSSPGPGLTPGKRKTRESEGSGEESAVFSSPEKNADPEDTQANWRMRLRERRVSEQSTTEETPPRRRRGSDRARKGSSSCQTDAKEEPPSPLVIGTSPSTQLQKVEKRLFHPLEQHRYWCPWVVEEQREGGTNAKGFHMVINSMKDVIARLERTNLASLKKYAGNIEAARSIRALLSNLGTEELQNQD